MDLTKNNKQDKSQSLLELVMLGDEENKSID